MPRFTLSTINPTYVFGPQAFASEATGELNSTNELIRGLLRLAATDTVPQFGGNAVDVRDVSRAHLAAIENPKLAGERIVASQARYSSQEILDIIHEHFPQLDGKLPRGQPGTTVSYGETIDESRSRKLLGYEYIELPRTVVDTVQQLLDVQFS